MQMDSLDQQSAADMAKDLEYKQQLIQADSYCHKPAVRVSSAGCCSGPLAWRHLHKHCKQRSGQWSTFYFPFGLPLGQTMFTLITIVSSTREL